MYSFGFLLACSNGRKAFSVLDIFGNRACEMPEGGPMTLPCQCRHIVTTLCLCEWLVNFVFLRISVTIFFVEFCVLPISRGVSFQLLFKHLFLCLTLLGNAFWSFVFGFQSMARMLFGPCGIFGWSTSSGHCKEKKKACRHIGLIIHPCF